MTDNSIETLIKLLTSDSTSAKNLLNLTSSEKCEADIAECAEKEQTQSPDKIQLKINLINAIIPLLSNETAQQAQFIIKLLSIMSIINQMKNNNSQ